MFQFKNEFGKATLTPVSDVMSVSDVSYAKMPEQIRQVVLSIEQAEQLALITENRKVQISYNMDHKLFYVVYHVTSDTVQLCRADIEYAGAKGETPAQTLTRLLRGQTVA